MTLCEGQPGARRVSTAISGAALPRSGKPNALGGRALVILTMHPPVHSRLAMFPLRVGCRTLCVASSWLFVRREHARCWHRRVRNRLRHGRRCGCRGKRLRGALTPRHTAIYRASRVHVHEKATRSFYGLWRGWRSMRRRCLAAARETGKATPLLPACRGAVLSPRLGQPGHGKRRVEFSWGRPCKALAPRTWQAAVQAADKPSLPCRVCEHTFAPALRVPA